MALLNVGYIQNILNDGAIQVRVYYLSDIDALGVLGIVLGPDQPLANGPNGYCLEVVNLSGEPAKCSYQKPSGALVSFNIGSGAQGTGLVTNRCRAALALTLAGYLTRGDVGNLMLGFGSN